MVSMLAPLTSQHMIALMWDGCTDVLASYEMQIRDSRQYVFARRIFLPLPTSDRPLRLNYVTFPRVLGTLPFSTTVTALHGDGPTILVAQAWLHRRELRIFRLDDERRTVRSLQRGPSHNTVRRRDCNKPFYKRMNKNLWQDKRQAAVAV